MKAIRLIEQSPKALKQIIVEKPLLLIPIGTVEWHADHLPLGVDSLLSVALCEGSLARQDVLSHLCFPVAFVETYHRSVVFLALLIQFRTDVIQCGRRFVTGLYKNGVLSDDPVQWSF